MSPTQYLTAKIEWAAGVCVTLQEDRDSWTGELFGYFAWANRDSDFNRSRTVATAYGQAPIETLDKLAAALGVAEEIAA